MKRFLTFLGVMLISVSSLACSVFASATSVVLKSAEPDEAKSFVNVSGNITGVNDEQQITYMITEVVDGKYDENNIYYINQNVYANSDGAFSFQLGVKGNLEADKTYIVRIGGTGIDTPVSIIVGTNGQGEVEFIIGDVNSDGKIDVNDASIALDYVLDPSAVDSKITSVERFSEKINVTGKEYVTSEDVACILQKALNSNYKFPVDSKEAADN